MLVGLQRILLFFCEQLVSARPPTQSTVFTQKTVGKLPFFPPKLTSSSSSASTFLVSDTCDIIKNIFYYIVHNSDFLFFIRMKGRSASAPAPGVTFAAHPNVSVLFLTPNLVSKQKLVPEVSVDSEIHFLFLPARNVALSLAVVSSGSDH